MPRTRRSVDKSPPRTYLESGRRGVARAGSGVAESVQRAVEDGRRLLGDCFLFQGLGTEERRSLTTRAHIRRFGAGDTIFLMGSPGTSMMAVLAGEVRISISSPEGKELLLAILQPGEVFG